MTKASTKKKGAPAKAKVQFGMPHIAGLSAAMSVGACAAFWYLYAQPTVASTQAAQMEISVLESKILQASQVRDNMPQIQNDNRTLEAKFQAFQSTFPAMERLSTLIDLVEGLAQNNSVRIGTIERRVEGTDVPNITRVKLSINMNGAFPNSFQYLKDLIAAQRYVSVDNLSLIKDNDGLNTAFTMYAFLSRAPATPTTPATGQPAPGSVPAQGQTVTPSPATGAESTPAARAATAEAGGAP